MRLGFYSAFHMDRLQLVWATQKHFSTPYSLLPTLSAKNNFVVYSNEKRCNSFVEWASLMFSGQVGWSRQDACPHLPLIFIPPLSNAPNLVLSIIAMCAGIFTNCRNCPIAKSLILSAFSSPYCLLPVACCLRTAL